jgi:cobalt/nickel transport system ATP-binding protein
MNERLIGLDKVSFAYGPDRPVLDECSFSLGRHDRVGLIGANGSGKTTLLSLVVGLVRAQSGSIEVLGKVRSRESEFHEIRGPVALLFQEAEDQLFNPTVAEDVAFGPLNLGKTREETLRIVDDTLRSLGLEGYSHRITHKLSGGEKRLVSLATVLAMRPEVLLLDEPTAGLDDDAVGRVTEILNGLPQPMLIVSHDRQFLSRMTNRSVRLAGGKLIEDGQP